MAIPLMKPAQLPKPPGPRIMRQNWGKLLFIHWPVEPTVIARQLPPEIELDLHDSQAWIGIVPFTMWGIRPVFAPPFPGLNAFHEVNVRTYVTYRGEPGVWFFSLDAASALAVWFGRTIYHLPYFRANMTLETENNRFRFKSTRTHTHAPDAEIALDWSAGEPLPKSRPGSLEWFLTERYRLFTRHRDRIYCSQVRHLPWPLRKARLHSFESNLIEAAGLPTPKGEPKLHHADELAVDIWPLRRKCEAPDDSAILDPTVVKPV